MNFYSIAPLIEKYYPQYYSIEEYPDDQCATIHKVGEEWGIFSNFFRCDLLIEGVPWKSTEQLFQVMKFKDRDSILAVYQANNPKMTAKHHEKLARRPDWGNMIVDAMKFCLQQKFNQCETFRQALADTQAQGLYIVEDQTSFHKKHADTWGVKHVGSIYRGPNLLGRLLMELRDNGKVEFTLPDDALDFLKVLNPSG